MSDDIAPKVVDYFSLFPPVGTPKGSLPHPGRVSVLNPVPLSKPPDGTAFLPSGPFATTVDLTALAFPFTARPS